MVEAREGEQGIHITAIPMAPSGAVSESSGEVTTDLCGVPEILVTEHNMIDSKYYDKYGPLYQPPKPLWPGLTGGSPATCWKDEEVMFVMNLDQSEGDQNVNWVDYYADDIKGVGLVCHTPQATSKTGITVPSNNYAFYKRFHEGIIYKQRIMDDKLGVMTEWKQPYKPTDEELIQDREEAYKKGIPHGVQPEGQSDFDKDLITLLVRSELHHDSEYGVQIGDDGKHYGGPGLVTFSLNMRIVDVHRVIQSKLGILPANQCLAFASKNFDDNQRTLEHYGVRFWHSKFPDWPLTIRRFKSSS